MLLKVTDVAERAGLSRVRVYALVRAGLLKPVPDVPYIVFRAEDVEEYLSRPKTVGRPPKPRAPRGRPRKHTTESSADVQADL